MKNKNFLDLGQVILLSVYPSVNNKNPLRSSICLCLRWLETEVTLVPPEAYLIALNKKDFTFSISFLVDL
jgi:uracil-DNA glycosylase